MPLAGEFWPYVGSPPCSALLAASLLGARFPRIVAWPLSAAGTFLGGLGLVRAARSTLSEREPVSDPDRTGSDTA